MSEVLIFDITDDESLYRRVLDGFYEVQDDGTVKFKSQAFTDVEFKTSVDQAKLCDNDPKRTLGNFSGGVVSLVAYDVRAIDDVKQYDRHQTLLQQFHVDVEHVPIINDPIEPDNLAHAEIHTIPECPNSRVFKRLRDRLALLANARQWELKPSKLLYKEEVMECNGSPHNKSNE